MINTEMKKYDYSTFGDKDEYGQKQLSEVKGQIKMAIYTTSQGIQDNIRYKDATYVGLTHAKVDDTYVINYGNERLKVLYVNTQGRYKQVFMKNL
ncbi:MAG: hypothetical protein E7536_03045 [Ruminococcaceae bacterium]|nr:hypothetical protein [Oscillospiraceae bacterium]